MFIQSCRCTASSSASRSLLLFAIHVSSYAAFMCDVCWHVFGLYACIYTPLCWCRIHVHGRTLKLPIREGPQGPCHDEIFIDMYKAACRDIYRRACCTRWASSAKARSSASRHGLHSYGLYSYGQYSYGLWRCGECEEPSEQVYILACIVMADVAMANIVIAYIVMACAAWPIQL